MDGITPKVSFQFNTPGALEADVTRARRAAAMHFKAEEVHPLDAVMAAFDPDHHDLQTSVMARLAQVWHVGRSIALQTCYPGASVPSDAHFWIDWTGGPIAR